LKLANFSTNPGLANVYHWQHGDLRTITLKEGSHFFANIGFHT